MLWVFYPCCFPFPCLKEVVSLGGIIVLLLDWVSKRKRNGRGWISLHIGVKLKEKKGN